MASVNVKAPVHKEMNKVSRTMGSSNSTHSQQSPEHEDRIFEDLQLPKELGEAQKAHPAIAEYLDLVNFRIQQLRSQIITDRQAKEKSAHTFERVIDTLHAQVDNQTVIIEDLQFQIDEQKSIMQDLRQQIEKQKMAIAGLPEKLENPIKATDCRRSSSIKREDKTPVTNFNKSNTRPTSPFLTSSKNGPSKTLVPNKRVSRLSSSPSPSLKELNCDGRALSSLGKSAPSTQRRGRSCTPVRNTPSIRRIAITDISASVIECIQQFSAKGFKGFRDFIEEYVVQQGVTDSTEKAYICRLLSVMHFSHLRELNAKFPNRDNYCRTTFYKVGRAAQYIKEMGIGLSLVKRYKDVTAPEFYNNDEIQEDRHLLAEYVGFRKLW